MKQHHTWSERVRDFQNSRLGDVLGPYMHRAGRTVDVVSLTRHRHLPDPTRAWLVLAPQRPATNSDCLTSYAHCSGHPRIFSASNPPHKQLLCCFFLSSTSSIAGRPHEPQPPCQPLDSVAQHTPVQLSTPVGLRLAYAYHHDRTSASTVRPALLVCHLSS